MSTETANTIRWCITIMFALLAVLYAFSILEASNGLMAIIFLGFAWVSHSAKIEMSYNKDD